MFGNIGLSQTGQKWHPDVDIALVVGYQGGVQSHPHSA